MDVVLVRESDHYYGFPIPDVVNVLENPQIIPYAFFVNEVKGVCNFYGSPLIYIDLFEVKNPYRVPFGVVIEDKVRLCVGVSDVVETTHIPERLVPLKGEFSFKFTKIAYKTKERIIEIVDVPRVVTHIINSLKEEKR